MREQRGILGVSSDRGDHSGGRRPPQAPGLGIALVVISTLFFACSDVTTKLLTATLPTLEVAWLRYASFAALVTVTSLAKQARQPPRTARPGLQIIRAVALAASAYLYAIGLSLLPVAVASATNFVAPVLIVTLAGLVLREPVSSRRWAATLMGLAGVLIVVRPGSAAFDWASLFPIAAALSFAVASIATRAIGHHDEALTTLLYTSLIGLVLLSVPLPLVWSPPTLHESLLGVSVGVFSTVGHWLIVRAARFAEASILAPFFYLQIVSTGALGIVVFGTTPDLWTATGSAIIIASGILSFYLERRL
jgi:drug/metabolite transporter (DMT)-like permease